MEKIMRGGLNINRGIAVLSDYQKKPTVVCGNGRSGTSGLMASLIGGGLPCVESKNSVTHEHFEMVRAWKGNDRSVLADLRNKISEDYSPTFFSKVPNAEWISYQKGWSQEWGGNYLGITRDITATVLREWSVDKQGRSIDYFYEVVQRSQNYVISNLAGLSAKWGVAIISYEKLLSSPDLILQGIADWVGFEEFDIKSATSMIQPNNYAYLKVHTGIMDPES